MFMILQKLDSLKDTVTYRPFVAVVYEILLYHHRVGESANIDTRVFASLG